MAVRSGTPKDFKTLRFVCPADKTEQSARGSNNVRRIVHESPDDSPTRPVGSCAVCHENQRRRRLLTKRLSADFISQKSCLRIDLDPPSRNDPRKESVSPTSAWSNIDHPRNFGQHSAVSVSNGRGKRKVEIVNRGQLTVDKLKALTRLSAMQST